MSRCDRPVEQPLVHLRLEGHCIETAARHALREVQTAAAADADALDEVTLAALETQLDLLIDLLQLADFRSLRADFPWLRGTASRQLALSRDPDGGLVLQGEAGERVRLPWLS